MSRYAGRLLLLGIAMLLAPLAGLRAADPNVHSIPAGGIATVAMAGESPPPVMIEPVDGAVTTIGFPHLGWEQALQPRADAMPSYDVQIAGDALFTRIVDEDRIAAVISRYVPDEELAPGEYWWRVASVAPDDTRGPWSAGWRFTVRPPERVFAINQGANFADIQKVLREAATHTPALVRFEKGDYRLDPHGATAFLDLAGANDLVVDGGGGSFTFAGFLKFVQLEHCRRVLVKNFTFDFDPLPYTAGRVLSVDAKAGAFEVEIAPGHPLPESNPHFERDRKGMIVDPTGPCIKRDVRLVFEHAGWEKLADRRYRFAAANPRQLGDLAPGDVYVLDPRIATGFDVDACNEVVFFHLVAHAVANEAFNSHYGNRLSILHCGICLKPGRFLAANNGGNNHHNARIGPWIEGCTWENTGDDVCHVNCLVMGVEEKLAPDRVRLPLRNPFDAVGPSVALDIRPGDLLQFFNRQAGRLLSQRRVVDVSKLPKSLDMTLDGEVGDIVCGRPGVKRIGLQKVPTDASVTQVFDASRTANQFVFRNNTVRNGRRIGVLAKGSRGLIEGNTFENIGGGAVELWNAPFEGLAASDYVVRHNRISGCGRLDREHAAIWATVFKTGGDRLHRNLLIDENEIQDFPNPAIWLRDVQSAVVRNNRITPAPPSRPAKEPVGPIMLRNTEAVRLEQNFMERRQGRPGVND